MLISQFPQKAKKMEGDTIAKTCQEERERNEKVTRKKESKEEMKVNQERD